MYQLKGHTATMRSSHAGPLGLPAPALPCPDSEAKAGRVWPCHRAWDVRDGMWSQHPGLLPPVVSLAVGSQLYQSCCPCMSLCLLGPGFLVSAVGREPYSTPAVHSACCVSSTGPLPSLFSLLG